MTRGTDRIAKLPTIPTTTPEQRQAKLAIEDALAEAIREEIRRRQAEEGRTP